MARFLLFLFLLAFLNTSGQNGSVDTSFGNNGYAITDFYGGWDRASMVAVQEDGKIVVFGFVDLSGGGYAEGLLRYLPDGSLDTTFGTDGLVTTSAGDIYSEYFNSLHIQPDQKIITSTTFLQNGEADYLLVRYLPNGDLDASFGVNGIVKTNYGEDNLGGTVLLSDGKILAGGSTSFGGNNFILLVRYMWDGSSDTSFGTNGTITHFINNESLKVFGIKVQSDGKIIVPYRTEENFVKKFQIARFLPNGVLDTGFGDVGIIELESSSEVFHSSISLQDDDKILVSLKKQPGTSIRRLLATGEIDVSFGNNGTMEIDSDIFTALKILVQPNNAIIVFGITFNFEPDFNRTYRLNPDGSLDFTFGTNGYTALGFEGADIALQENGKILIAGSTFFYSGPVDFVVARLNNGLLEVPNYEMSSFIAYPNPANSIFTIQQAFLPENRMYQITDVLGKIITSGELSENDSTIDLSTAQSGIYFLKTQVGSLRLVKN